MEKFEVELKIVKNKIHEEDLTEDFRDKLERQLYEKYNNANANKIKFKLLRRPLLACKNVAAVFVCFLLLSGCAFADEIEDLIKSMFSNVSQNAEIAYEEGNCIKVDSEYQTYGDISANVEYISSKDNELYIVFNINIKKIKEYTKKTPLDDAWFTLTIEGTKTNTLRVGNLALTLEDESGEIKYSGIYDVKRNTTNDCQLISKLILKNVENIKVENLNITFNSIILEKENENNKNIGNWMFNLNLYIKKD